MGRRLERGQGIPKYSLPSCDPGVLPCRICMGRRAEGAGHTYILPTLLRSGCVAL